MTDLPSNTLVAKATRATELVKSLRLSILRGELLPGEKVGLDHLRDHYQVSLSPLREAISRLVSSGLIEMEDQRGYRIAPVTVANLAEVTELRSLLEAQALKASISHADLDWESAVLGALHRANRTPRGAGDPGNAMGQDDARRDFHETLIANCDMPILLNMCRNLFDLNTRYLHLFGAGLADDPVLQAERRAIADVAVDRNASLAAALLCQHIERQGAVLGRNVAAALNENNRFEGAK